MPIFDPGIFDPDIFDTGGAASTNAPAGAASGSGSAGSLSISVNASAIGASGSGSAADAAPSTASSFSAAADIAAGVGSSAQPSADVQASAGVASGTGIAGDASISFPVFASADVATGTGAAFDATTVAVAFVNAPAAKASGTGAAYNPTIAITRPWAFPLVAAGTGKAWIARARELVTAGAGLASGGVGTGVGTAYNPALVGETFVIDPGSSPDIAGTRLVLPSYQGASGTIHVEPDSFETPAPVGPLQDRVEPVLVGAAPKLTTHSDSPAQWSDASITGPYNSVPHYRGRSAAIHVFGRRETRDPPPPIPGCKCCAESAGSDCTHITTADDWFNFGGGTGTYDISADGLLSVEMTTTSGDDLTGGRVFRLSGGHSFYDFVHGGGFTLVAEFDVPADATDWDVSVAIAVTVTGGGTSGQVYLAISELGYMCQVIDLQESSGLFGNPDHPFDAGPHTLQINIGSSSCVFTVDGEELHTIDKDIDLSTLVQLDLGVYALGPTGGTVTGKVTSVAREDETSAPWCTGDPAGDCESSELTERTCVFEHWDGSHGWGWKAGYGTGAYTGDGWSIDHGVFRFDGSNALPDQVSIHLTYAAQSAFFDHLRGGSFVLSGQFTIPNLDQTPPSTGSYTRSPSWVLRVGFNDGGFPSRYIVLSAVNGAGVDDVNNRVELTVTGATGDVLYGTGTIAAGTYAYTLTVTPTLVTATIAGHSLSVTVGTALNFAVLNNLLLQMGEGPSTTEGPTIADGPWISSALDARRVDGTKASWCFDSIGEGCGDCPEVTTGVVHGWTNRTAGHVVLRHRNNPVNGGGTPDGDYRFTQSTTNNWVSDGGLNQDGVMTEGRQRLFFTHTAPAGATYARLRTQIEATVHLLYPQGTGYTDSIPLHYAFRSGAWGAALPNYDDAGAVVASGLVNFATSGLNIVAPLAPVVDIVLPVVGGRVQWVMEIDADAQTLWTGYNYPTYAPQTCTPWPSTGAGEHYGADLFFKTPGNTSPGINRNYQLEYYSGSQPPCTACGECAECTDPETGLQIPDFTPGFMPTFRKQIGDPTTSLDSFICTLESAAMILDWHTRGAVSVWGGELIPYCGKTEAEIGTTGSNLNNARLAWLHWSQILDNRSGQTFAQMMAALAEGRALILQGDYGEFNLAERCQNSFDGNHAIAVFPYQVSDRLLIGDPLCSNFTSIRISSLQRYAETFGAAVLGSSSPQRILFAVSRPWTP